MATQIVSLGQLTINDSTIAIVPNSLEIDLGNPEIEVKGLAIGASEFESVHAINAESAVSMVKFNMFFSTDLPSTSRVWKANVASNVIKFLAETSSGDSVTITCSGMSLKTKLNFGVGSDKDVPFEFSGDIAVIS